MSDIDDGYCAIWRCVNTYDYTTLCKEHKIEFDKLNDVLSENNAPALTIGQFLNYINTNLESDLK